MRVLVAGFGNELIPGDDCGLRVVDALAGERLPGGVDVRRLGRGVQALIHLLPGYDVAILVDASRRVEPGRVRVEQLDCSAARDPQSLHEAGLVEAACMALEAAEALGRRPRVYIVECGVGASTSPPIREAVEVVKGLLVEAESGP